MFDIDDVKRRHAEACALDACKDKIITELCERIEALSVELQEAKEELDDQKQLAASYKAERNDKENRLKDMRRIEGKLSYVSVLIDGDGMNFHERFIQDRQNGGYEAAQLLIEAVDNHVKKAEEEETSNNMYKIRVRVYANVQGLTQAYRDASIIRGDENLTTFIQAFNKANTLCDFVDAGNGKECADVKLKAHFEQDIVDVHCLRIVFCASADNGYARVLGPHKGSKRISLVKGPPFAHEMEELADSFRTASFESVFMSHKLRSTRRVSFGTTSTSTSPPRASTPNYASAAKKSPPLQSPPLAVNSSTPNAGTLKLHVYTNARGQRVDQRLSYSSKENVEKLKRQKLCNRFHLFDSCFYDDCTHKHGLPLSSQDKNDLMYIARFNACPNGLYCTDAKCTCGHRCPHASCPYVNCKFPEDMHGVDTSITSQSA